LSGARGRANHELYLAKIVLGAWRRELELQQIPASTLAQAFEEGAGEHLAAAYGWFLLAVIQAEGQQDRPPRGCQELPPLPAGKVFPPEINELRQLEANGWLGDMLRIRAPEHPRPPQQLDNLAVASRDIPGIEQLTQWRQQLAALFDRVGDSLDEY